MDYLQRLITATIFIFLPLTVIVRFAAFKWCILLIGRRIFYVVKAIKESESFSEENCIFIMSFTNSFAAIKYLFHKLALQTLVNPFPV
jgi:hypothetical protein